MWTSEITSAYKPQTKHQREKQQGETARRYGAPMRNRHVELPSSADEVSFRKTPLPNVRSLDILAYHGSRFRAGRIDDIELERFVAELS